MNIKLRTRQAGWLRALLTLTVLGLTTRVFAEPAQEGRAPGSADLHFSAPRDRPTELCIRIDDREQTRTIELRLQPMSAPREKAVAVPPVMRPDPALAPASHPPVQAQQAARVQVSLPTYVLAAGALSMLAAGVGLAVSGRHALDEFRDRCAARGCDHDDGAHGRRLYVAADVTLALSAGFLAAALWSYFAQDHAPEKSPWQGAPSKTRLRQLPSLSVADKSAALSWGVRF
jgi:hypothetical protein